MRPLIARVVFPRPRPPQDGWLQTGSTPPVFDATTVVAALAQQRGWYIEGVRRPPLAVPAIGWWIAETFTPEIFWSAVTSQQRAWATAPRRKAFFLRPQEAWWAETLPVAFDVTITVASAMAQFQARPTNRRIERARPWTMPQDAWITANVPAAVAGESFIPVLRRRRR